MFAVEGRFVRGLASRLAGGEYVPDDEIPLQIECEFLFQGHEISPLVLSDVLPEFVATCN